MSTFLVQDWLQAHVILSNAELMSYLVDVQAQL